MIREKFARIFFGKFRGNVSLEFDQENTPWRTYGAFDVRKLLWIARLALFVAISRFDTRVGALIEAPLDSLKRRKKIIRETAQTFAKVDTLLEVIFRYVHRHQIARSPYYQFIDLCNFTPSLWSWLIATKVAQYADEKKYVLFLYLCWERQQDGERRNLGRFFTRLTRSAHDCPLLHLFYHAHVVIMGY